MGILRGFPVPGPVRGIDFHKQQPLFVSGGDDYKIKVKIPNFLKIFPKKRGLGRAGMSPGRDGNSRVGICGNKVWD